MLPELRQLFEEERERVQPLLEKGLNFAASYGKLKVCPFTICKSVRLLYVNFIYLVRLSNSMSQI